MRKRVTFSAESSYVRGPRGLSGPRLTAGQSLIRHQPEHEDMSDADEASMLVVVAHPDDECLGAGGTIRRHVELGIPVSVLCLTGNDERNAELNKACKTLGVAEVHTSMRGDFDVDWSLSHEIAQTILRTRPKIIITHSVEDYNRNHVLCAQIVMEAVEWASHVTMFDDAHRVERIYNMEINSLLSRPSIMVDVSDCYDTSVQALKQHKSQISKARGFYANLYDARTRLRGVQAACDRAEAFGLTPLGHAGPFYPANSVRSLI